VVVADGDRDFVETLRAGLERDARVQGVGAAATASELLDLVEILSPDIALVDLDLDPAGAADAIQLIGRTRSSTQVLVLVRDDEDGVFRARAAGASGYMRKTSGADGLRESFFELASLVGALSADPSQPPDSSQPPDP